MRAPPGRAASRRHGFVVLELNGAVDFTSDCPLGGRDVFGAVAAALDDLVADPVPNQ